MKLPSGFAISGTINLLGYTIECQIVVDLKKGIIINVKLAPLKIAKGLIELQRSGQDSKNGPLFDAKISPKAVEVTIKGYISILGISTEVNIDISGDKILFYVAGNLFNIIRADLQVESTSKPNDLENSSFKVMLRIIFKFLT